MESKLEGHQQKDCTARDRTLEYLVRIELAWACFGFVVSDGVVTKAAPISKWAVGKRGRYVVDYWRSRGAAVIWTEVEWRTQQQL